MNFRVFIKGLAHRSGRFIDKSNKQPENPHLILTKKRATIRKLPALKKELKKITQLRPNQHDKRPRLISLASYQKHSMFFQHLPAYAQLLE